MSAVFIRTAGEKDLAAVSVLLGKTWHATYDPIYGPGKVDEITRSWHSVSALRPRLTRPTSEFLLADDGKNIVAMAFAATSAEGRVVVVHQLYVDPAHQRHGIGRDLLAEIVDCFPTASSLRAEVEEANVAAVAFWRRAGFMLTGHTETEMSGGDVLPVAIYERPIA
jgi:ribosomal protein S18 acetylase RimI-like enzyme